eukprot:737598_1
MSFDIPALVLDVGSCLTKCGYCGENVREEAKIFNTAVGVDSHPECGDHGKQYFCGDNLKVQKGQIEVITPIKHGLVENWEALEHLWDFSFRRVLTANPEGGKLMLSEAAFNDDSRRDKFTELAFEKFQFSSAYVAKDAVLESFAVARSTCLVVSCGAGVTQCVPVFEGRALLKGARRTRIAGNYIDNLLLGKLVEKSVGNLAGGGTRDEEHMSESLIHHLKMENVREMKHGICEIYPVKLQPSMYSDLENKKWLLPDGNTLDLSRVGWTLPEILFSSLQVPSDLDKSYKFDGLGQMVIDAISACTVDHRAQLYKSWYSPEVVAT